ncbi:MAG: C_GCAxxG_C_C family protein [Rhodospirillales bacterium]|nr:C_GCAxxG_C_C family protein [Rhodospirillales bacterium]
MSSAVIKALSHFEPHDPGTLKLNCGQAVLAGLADRIGIDEKTAIGAGRPFAGGIGHQGNVCGALIAGAIALGFATGARAEPSNRQTAYKRTRELFRLFSERHGNVECRLLIGIDPSTPEGEHEVHTRNIHHTHCTAFVRSAVEIVEDLLQVEIGDIRRKEASR